MDTCPISFEYLRVKTNECIPKCGDIEKVVLNTKKCYDACPDTYYLKVD